MATVPDGPHTPVSNAPPTDDSVIPPNFEESFHGEDGNEQPFTKDGREDVPRPPASELRPAEKVWKLPDTSRLADVGVASYGPPRPILETVHGPDDRIQIKDTSKFPWRASAALLITAADGSLWSGTGWFIGPRTLATAGHCVCIKNSGVAGRDGWVKSIQVVPGRNGDTAPYGAATSAVFWSVKGWVDAGDENYDYAAVVIPSALGKQTGWFGFGVADDQILRASMGNIAGYPADKGGETVWWDARQLASTTATKVYYDIDSYGGQSGAAVYIIQDGKRIALAVHAYGGSTTNSGTRISLPVFQNLKQWKAL